MKKSNLIFRLIFLITIILLLLLRLFYLTYINIEKVEVEPQIEEEPSPIITQIDTEKEEIIDENYKKLKELHKENTDTVGYLVIPGTKIDYPVMYTKGEDYYLRKSFKKIYSVAGSLYIDKHNNIIPRDDNIIIYGHNMNDGTMFADLLKYKNKAFFTGHKTIYYYTLNGLEEYTIVSAFISKVYSLTDDVFKYYKQYNFKDSNEFEYFKDSIMNLSIYDTYTEINYRDVFITLSTCEYTEKNGRFVVIAKKVLDT